jgi:hypothetical protein
LLADLLLFADGLRCLRLFLSLLVGFLLFGFLRLLFDLCFSLLLLFFWFLFLFQTDSLQTDDSLFGLDRRQWFESLQGIILGKRLHSPQKLKNIPYADLPIGFRSHQAVNASCPDHLHALHSALMGLEVDTVLKVSMLPDTDLAFFS